MTSRFFPAALFLLTCFHCLASPASATNGKDADVESAAILDTNQCRPVYPRTSAQRGEQGTVKMQFTVGANGKLAGSAIIKSSGYRELDQAALNALIHCRFKPAYRDGRPVQAAFVMEYLWQLQQ